MLHLFLKDIAKKENLHLQKSADLKSLIDLMNINHKGVVVVLDGNCPVGIMTERDIVEIIHKGIDLKEEIGGYAKKALVTTSGSRTIGYALNLTLENNIRRVIVTDDANEFLGMVTLQDLLKYLEEDFYRLPIKVKHIVKGDGCLISVLPDDDVKSAMGKMVENKISAVPVMEGKRAVGIVTEKDILRLVAANIPLENKVSNHMSGPVNTATLDTPLVEVVEVLNYRSIRRIVVVDKDGAAINMVTIRDVIENLEGDYNKFLERKLKSAKEILNLLPEMLIEIVDTEDEQLIIWANDMAIRNFGEDIIDSPIEEFFSKGKWSRINDALTKLGRIEHIKMKKDSEIYELSGFFIKTFSGVEKGRFHIIMRDITEDIKLSTIDPLTNIYNRRFINGYLVKEIERSRRMDRHFSIVISDIDDFKYINDTFGHLSGDMVLKEISRIIPDTFRKQDVVGRYGGDEFMIILPDANMGIASGIIDRLRHDIESSEIEISKNRHVRVTGSFGIATFPEDGTSLDDLLVTADERLYQAKGLGKNKVACG